MPLSNQTEPDEFDVLHQKIDQLKAEAEKYANSHQLEDISIVTESVKADIEVANKELADVELKINESKDKLAHTEEVIKEKIKIHNQKIKLERDNLSKECELKITELSSQEKENEILKKSLVSQTEALEQSKLALQEKRAELDEQVKAYQKYNLALEQREEAIKQVEANNEVITLELNTLSKDLIERESALTQKENEININLQQTKDMKQSASILKNKNQSDAADLQAKENMLVQRELGLSSRESKVKKLEIALNDRASILTSNGL